MEINEEYPDVEIDWQSVAGRLRRDFWCIETEAGIDPPSMLLHVLTAIGALLDQIDESVKAYKNSRSDCVQGRSKKLILSRNLRKTNRGQTIVAVGRLSM